MKMEKEEKLGTCAADVSTNVREFAKHVVYPGLNPTMTVDQISRLHSVACTLGVAAVSLPLKRLNHAIGRFPDGIDVSVVIGYPFGFSVVEENLCAAVLAISNGADEIELIISMDAIISEDVLNSLNAVRDEIRQMRHLCSHLVLKVTIVPGYLSEKQKKRICNIVTDEKVDYLKLSTGLGEGEVTLEDVRFFRKYLGAKVRIEVEKEVETIPGAKSLIEAGCDRICSAELAQCLMEELRKPA